LKWFGRNEKSEIFVGRMAPHDHRKQNFIPWYYLLSDIFTVKMKRLAVGWLKIVTEIVAALARAFISS
jgi:hypothetical protein